MAYSGSGTAPFDSLAERLQQGPLPLRTALRYAAEVAGTLRGLHNEGRFHGDVEPSMIRITQAGALLAPPNGRSHLADARTDISAFGALLYQMLTGARPADVAVSAPTGDHETVRLSATRLAARCLGAAPDPPADIHKVATEVRLLGVLARQRSGEPEIAPAVQSAVPASAAVEESQVAHTPEDVQVCDSTEASLAPVEASPESLAAEPAKPLNDVNQKHQEEDASEHAEQAPERCPRCGGYLGSPSRPRSAFESLLRAFGFPLRRCSRCFHRYVIFLGLPIHRTAHV